MDLKLIGRSKMVKSLPLIVLSFGCLIILNSSCKGSDPRQDLYRLDTGSRQNRVLFQVVKNGLTQESIGHFSPFVALDKDNKCAAIISSDRTQVSFLTSRKDQIQPVSYVAKSDSIYLSATYANYYGAKPSLTSIEWIKSDAEKSIFQLVDK